MWGNWLKFGIFGGYGLFGYGYCKNYFFDVNMMYEEYVLEVIDFNNFE